LNLFWSGSDEKAPAGIEWGFFVTRKNSPTGGRPTQRATLACTAFYCVDNALVTWYFEVRIFPPTVPENLVGCDGETSEFRDLRVRHAVLFGGEDAMKEVFLFIRQKDALMRPRSCIGGRNEIRSYPS
jgi:hypothetical protein